MSEQATALILDAETGLTQSVRWQSAHGWQAPARIEQLASAMAASRAYRHVSQGKGLLWTGDYHEGRTLLNALKRRINERAKTFENLPWPQRFHSIRQQRSQSARMAGLLLVQVQPGFRLTQARAPDIQAACQMAYGGALEQVSFIVPLTELLGVLSAYQWHCSGLPVAQLGHCIYPRWGVFAPTRNEYLELVAHAPLPQPCQCAVDVGTGTGVLAMILAKRGIAQVIATDLHPGALACASDHVQRFALQSQIQVQQSDLLPEGRFDLLVCNPPWLPGAASSELEAAVYDPQHRMLRGFLEAAPSHMTPSGQAWLILSDLAEHLKLREREQLLAWIAGAGLEVIERIDIKPTHPKRQRVQDPLHEARQREVTSLWRLSASA
jgi:methylase of polypeptide subunit release factors